MLPEGIGYLVQSTKFAERSKYKFENMTNCADHGQGTETKFVEPYLKVFWLNKDDVKGHSQKEKERYRLERC